MIELRPYQTDFVGNLRSAMRRHRRVIGVAATGAGKTIVFTYIANSSVQRGKRVIIAAHRAEIVSQISKALTAFDVRHGWIMPGRTTTTDMVQVAMIQTLARRLDRVPSPDLLIIDEAHHATSGAYRAVMDAWDSAYVLGVSATPERLDGRGLSEVFDEMVLGPQTRWLIDQGFLSQYTHLAPPQVADFSGVKTSMGDYAVDDLASVMDQSTITGDLIAHYRQHLSGKSAIAFCVNIAHAEHVAEQFSSVGIAAASIDGKTETPERMRLLDALGSCELKVLTSCDLIGEGVDVPSVNGAILARPTKSLSLYRQQVGRVLRLKPDGSKAVILDHVGNVHRHGMPDIEINWTLSGRQKKKSAPTFKTKTCKTCFRVFAVAPGWQAAAECGAEPGPECALSDQDAPAPREIKHLDGELQVITDTPDWAGGINIMRAQGVEFKAMIHKAQTKDQLKQIARARGYKRGWEDHIMRQRGRRKEAAE